MSRSVNYLNDAVYVGYINFQCDSENIDVDSEYEWECFRDWLADELKAKYKSFFREWDKWEGNETRIILENNFVSVGLSAYCGLVSISIAPRYSEYGDFENLAINWINQVSSGVDKILASCPWGEQLNKVGSFSNGEGVFEKSN